ncbi:hypothetical protein B0H13DRAFT_2411293 [Mycena leptocephala]|nr:hypothetical protein B0H13DRAFT_2411293 [Mycena leptocephala]
MLKFILDDIWSMYTISPDPTSGTPTLRDTCAALLSHTLSSSDIIPGHAGFTLHSRLANPLRQTVTNFQLITTALAQAVVVDSVDLCIVLGPTTVDWKVTLAWDRIIKQLADVVQLVETSCVAQPVQLHQAARQTASASRMQPSVSVTHATSPSIAASWWMAPGTPYKSSKSFFTDMSKASRVSLAKRPLACGPVGGVGEAFIERFPDAPASRHALPITHAPTIVPHSSIQQSRTTNMSAPPVPVTSTAPAPIVFASIKPTGSIPQRDFPARQASRVVEDVLDNGATCRMESALTDRVTTKGSVSSRAKTPSTHETPFPSDERDRKTRLVEYAPRREVPSRRVGCAVEEVLDNATRRADTTSIDQSAVLARIVAEKGLGYKEKDTHKPACSSSSTDWCSTARIPSLPASSSSSADAASTWRSTRITLPMSTASSWHSKGASSTNGSCPDTARDSQGVTGSSPLKSAVDRGHIRDGISEAGSDKKEALTVGKILLKTMVAAPHPRILCVPQGLDLAELVWPAIRGEDELRREQREAAAAARHVNTLQGEQGLVYAPSLPSAQAHTSRSSKPTSLICSIVSIAATKETVESAGLEERSPARSRGGLAEEDGATKCRSDELQKKGQISIVRDLNTKGLTGSFIQVNPSFPTPAVATTLAADKKVADAEGLVKVNTPPCSFEEISQRNEGDKQADAPLLSTDVLLDPKHPAIVLEEEHIADLEPGGQERGADTVRATEERDTRHAVMATHRESLAAEDSAQVGQGRGDDPISAMRSISTARGQGGLGHAPHLPSASFRVPGPPPCADSLVLLDVSESIPAAVKRRASTPDGPLSSASKSTADTARVSITSDVGLKKLTNALTTLCAIHSPSPSLPHAAKAPLRAKDHIDCFARRARIWPRRENDVREEDCGVDVTENPARRYYISIGEASRAKRRTSDAAQTVREKYLTATLASARKRSFDVRAGVPVMQVTAQMVYSAEPAIEAGELDERLGTAIQQLANPCTEIPLTLDPQPKTLIAHEELCATEAGGLKEPLVQAAQFSNGTHRNKTQFKSKIFALVSAIIWTPKNSYLEHPLGGESTPYREWAREGIGMRHLIFELQAQARDFNFGLQYFLEHTKDIEIKRRRCRNRNSARGTFYSRVAQGSAEKIQIRDDQAPQIRSFQARERRPVVRVRGWVGIGAERTTSRRESGTARPLVWLRWLRPWNQTAASVTFRLSLSFTHRLLLARSSPRWGGF